jgi:hypothetical protein
MVLLQVATFRLLVRVVMVRLLVRNVDSILGWLEALARWELAATFTCLRNHGQEGETSVLVY